MATDPWTALTVSLPEDNSRPAKKKRKKHRIACGQCGRPMNLWGYHYTCPHCGVKHRAHPNGEPTGVPGDQKTAQARMKAHKAFDQIWKSGKVSRQQAYTILRRIMGMTIQEAHIGRFTWEQCQFLIARLGELGERVYGHPYNVNGFLNTTK